jgi:hypothetical protein
MSEWFWSSVSTVLKTVSSWEVKCSSKVCAEAAELEAAGRFVVRVVLVGGVMARSLV